MLIDTIKADLKTAMLAKDEDKKNSLRLVLGEVPRLNKKANEEVKDEEVITIINRLLKSEDMTQSYSGQDSFPLRDALNDYLPKMMTEEEIKEWILTNIDTFSSNKMKAMGNIMKSLKGKADGGMVRKVLMQL